MVDIIGLSKIRAVINDSLYGSIPVNEIEYNIIQTPVFNRLHNIRQLGPTYLIYPGAKHSRFEHSLGVMHLASKMLENILSTLAYDEFVKLFNNRTREFIFLLFREGVFSELRYLNIHDVLKAFLVQSIRLAGLLHDLGHYPYSHVVEEGIGKRGLHEKITHELILSWKELREILLPLTYELNGSKVTGITPEHVVAILMNSFHRRRLLSESKSYIPLLDSQGYNLLHKVISGVFDADRLDYLRRDALHTGVVYGIVDIDRIIDSMHVVRDKDSFLIYYDLKALPALEDMLSSRIKMYKLVYYHHKNVLLAEITRRMIYEAIRLSDQKKDHRYKRMLVDDIVNTLISYPWKVTDNLLIDIAEYLLNNATRHSKAYYYAEAFLNRQLLPMTIFKREEDLYHFIATILNGNIKLSKYRLLINNLVKDINKLEDYIHKESNGEIELLTASIKYHGVSPKDILIKVGDTLVNMSKLSHYIKWLDKYYTGYKHVYMYIYTLDQEKMIKYKRDPVERKKIVNKVLKLIRNFILNSLFDKLSM
ncbi:MAG: hypothetical protein DRO40_03020 [Thermoprotei archaeon]|nr:MAG: hypothetical protein DRO40_03020 [Thermoprotei archaeon]